MIPNKKLENTASQVQCNENPASKYNQTAIPSGNTGLVAAAEQLSSRLGGAEHSK